MALVLVLRRLLDLPLRAPRWSRWLTWLWVPAVAGFVIEGFFDEHDAALGDAYWALVVAALGALLVRLRHYEPARTVLLAAVPPVLHWLVWLALAASHHQLPSPYSTLFDTWEGLNYLWFGALLVVARNQKKHLLKEELARAEEEKAQRLMAAQKAELERLVAERTATLTRQAEELQAALTELRATQAQLVQREKMASLGELTAGIAHEIQNPLNFVNNFADVSAELVAELEAERTGARNGALEVELLLDLKGNLQRIAQHGGRAASIVKRMLAHSRISTGEQQPTDLNALCDEYLSLAYHGLRAKDQTFNATLAPTLAPGLPCVPAVAGEVGQVLLNLFTNAFYAVQKRAQRGEPGYVPTVGVATRRAGPRVEVRVRDNGTGIPEEVRAKVFQPFFTTKPAGEGAGLGLSLSHDIITKGHGGALTFTSRLGQGTEFVVALPIHGLARPAAPAGPE